MRQYLFTALPFLTTTLLPDANFAGATTIEPSLVFGDINVLVLTDVHSWIAGHGRQEPMYDADYGDVLSFYERLKAYLDEKGQDLWFVSNGDFVHGTGLSAPGDPSSLIPLIEKLPFDAVNCGNHELYEDSVVQYITRPGGYVDWWGDRYITGNIMLAKEDPPRPLGQLYRLLKGKNSNLLVLGFLYNMGDSCSLINVEQVENVVKSAWFTNVLNGQGELKVDAILVLAHMDLKDPLVDVILKAVRGIVGDKMPIQFITGHTHYRGVEKVDDLSVSFEAGKYLDTVGFVSFPTKSTASTLSVNGTKGTFQSVFMDGNKKFLAETLGLNDAKQLQTQNGKELSNFITRTRNKMGLMEEIGCAPQDYFLNTSLDDKHSLWGLYRDEVIPKMFFAEDKDDSIMFLEKEAWRYDILSYSSLIVDDIIAVAPFHDIVVRIGSVPGSAILQLNSSMNEESDPYLGALPRYILIGSIDNKEKIFHLYVHDFHQKEILKRLGEILPNKSFVPEKTEFSSTMLWLSFIREYWACNGKLDDLPDWIPSPESSAKKTGKESNEQTRVNTSLLRMIFVGTLGVVTLRWIYVLILYIWSGFTPITQEEIESSKYEEGNSCVETWKKDTESIEGQDEDGEQDFLDVDENTDCRQGKHNEDSDSCSTDNMTNFTELL